jgi:hypothetical protein
MRAFTAASLYLNGDAPSIELAAVLCGSCAPYVRAAVPILQAGDSTLKQAVVTGEVSLLAAGEQVKHLSDLVTPFDAASADDRVAFARAIGPARLFDEVVVPAV